MTSYFILSMFSAVLCRTHHSGTALPSNGETNRRDVLYNQDAVDRGVGVGRNEDKSAASNSQHRDFATEMITYRTHNIQSGDINMLSQQTAAACSVQDVRGNTRGSEQPSSDGANQESTNLSGGNSQTISHSINIIKNIGEQTFRRVRGVYSCI